MAASGWRRMDDGVWMAASDGGEWLAGSCCRRVNDGVWMAACGWRRVDGGE
jgi:hypothetical protein